MKKCSYAKNYKGIFQPTCDGGRGCEACWKIFQDKCIHPVTWLEYNDHTLKCALCKLTLDIPDEELKHRMLEWITQLSQRIESVQQELYYK